MPGPFVFVFLGIVTTLWEVTLVFLSQRRLRCEVAVTHPSSEEVAGLWAELCPPHSPMVPALLGSRDVGARRATWSGPQRGPQGVVCFQGKAGGALQRGLGPC
jgi:hypothetical protein